MINNTIKEDEIKLLKEELKAKDAKIAILEKTISENQHIFTTILDYLSIKARNL